MGDGACISTEKRSQVYEQLDHINDELEVLKEVMVQFSDKLSSVLAPCIPNIDSTDKPKATLVPLAEMLSNIKTEIREVTFLVRSLKDRVEL